MISDPSWNADPLSVLNLPRDVADQVRQDAEDLGASVRDVLVRYVSESVSRRASGDYTLAVPMNPGERGAFDGLCTIQGVDPSGVARCAVLSVLHEDAETFDLMRQDIESERKTGVHPCWQDFEDRWGEDES